MDPDVIIVGGGVTGAASAFFAARAGLRPLLVEKRAGLGTLTTSASLAAFRAQFSARDTIEMMLESIRFFEKLQCIQDIGLTQQGYLLATTSGGGYQKSKKRVELQHSLGLNDVELLDGDEARRHFPYLSRDVTAATFRARDGWLNAHELTYYYVRASGAQVALDTTVERIVFEAGRVQGIQAGDGIIRSPRVVVAAGPFSQSLVGPLGLLLPISLVRRQRAAIKWHPLIPRRAAMTIDLDTGAHWKPDGQGAVLAWALPEPPSEPLEEVAADWDFAAAVIDGAARISPFWAEIGERLKRSDLDVRAGQYDMTPDARPFISAPPEFPGLYIHCGYSGHGVMASPGGGRRLADLLIGKLEEAENPFRLARPAPDPGSGEHMVL